MLSFPIISSSRRTRPLIDYRYYNITKLTSAQILNQTKLSLWLCPLCACVCVCMCISSPAIFYSHSFFLFLLNVADADADAFMFLYFLVFFAFMAQLMRQSVSFQALRVVQSLLCVRGKLRVSSE